MSETDEHEAALQRRAWTAARQWRVAALAALIAALIVLGSKFAHALFDGAPAPPPAALEAPGTFRASPQQLKTLTIETVRAHAFESEEATEGKIAVNADHAVPVVSPYSGRVARLIASPGDRVKRDAPLALIDASEFVQAQNDLKVAASQAKLARTNETRKHALYDAKGGSMQDWQQAQADLSAAEAALAAVRDRLHIFGKSDADIEHLETSAGIEPSVVLAAPIAGVVVDRQLGPGQVLQSGSTLFTLADTSSVWLLANVREADAERVRLGQRVEVRVLAYPERLFKAELTYVGALIDPNTHRLPVRAVIDNRDGALKPEMFASFRIITSEPSDSPAIDEYAVIYEGDSAHVWVAGADGLLSYRRVHTGRIDHGLVEITDGLKADERVVTRGALFVDQAATPPST